MSSIQEETSYIARKVDGAGCFALIRKPGSAGYEMLVSDECPQRLNSIDSIEGRSGWVAAPFMTLSEAPIIYFVPTISESRPVPLSYSFGWQNLVSPLDAELEEKVCYRRGFDFCLNHLSGGDVKKVVYARRERFEMAVEADASFCISLFLKACVLQRMSYVSLWTCGDGNYWLVSTPEVLLSGNLREGFRTMALAGTMLWSETVETSRWSMKNREEQALVATYIKNRLERIGCTPRLYGPYPVRAGNVAHLRTDISFAVPDECSPAKVVEALHPTPAVCGLPSDKVVSLIAEAENFQRKYYAGFSGIIDYEGNTDLYVSLRCMELSGKEATLYAGGGLLQESKAEDEWVETCRKMRAMEQLFEK